LSPFYFPGNMGKKGEEIRAESYSSGFSACY